MGEGPDRKTEFRLILHLSNEEEAMLRELASMDGLARSQWVRMMIRRTFREMKRGDRIP